MNISSLSFVNYMLGIKEEPFTEAPNTLLFQLAQSMKYERFSEQETSRYDWMVEIQNGSVIALVVAVVASILLTISPVIATFLAGTALAIHLDTERWITSYKVHGQATTTATTIDSEWQPVALRLFDRPIWFNELAKEHAIAKAI